MHVIATAILVTMVLGLIIYGIEKTLNKKGWDEE